VAPWLLVIGCGRIVDSDMILSRHVRTGPGRCVATLGSIDDVRRMSNTRLSVRVVMIDPADLVSAPGRAFGRRCHDVSNGKGREANSSLCGESLATVHARPGPSYIHFENVERGGR
jgi:hypothetical protein